MAMPNASAALAISFVISMSSRDGLGSPEDGCAPVYTCADFPLSVAIYAIRETTGVVEWCMFLVLTRDFPRSNTAMLLGSLSLLNTTSDSIRGAVRRGLADQRPGRGAGPTDGAANPCPGTDAF